MSRGQGTVYRRGRIWWIQLFLDGVRHYESSRSPKKTDAIKLLKQRQSEIEVGNFSPEKITVSTLLDDLLVHYRLNNPRSVEDFAVPVVRKHLRPYWGRHRPHQVTTPKLVVYQDRRLKDGAAPATVNRELSLLRRAFNLARKAGKIQNVPYFPMLKERNVRTGFLEVEQYRRLKNELPKELKPLLVVGYHVGDRLGELLPLSRSQVDLDRLEITLPPGTTKNDEGRVLPIFGEMTPVLEAQLGELNRDYPDCRYVFHRGGKPIKDFQDAWEKACERAGVPELLFHDLRRSAVRNLIRAGVPERVAMAISGHKTRAIFDRYNIVSGKDLREAGELVSRYLGGGDGESRTPKASRPVAPKATASASSATSPKVVPIRSGKKSA